MDAGYRLCHGTKKRLLEIGLKNTAGNGLWGLRLHFREGELNGYLFRMIHLEKTMWFMHFSHEFVEVVSK